jgi:hypothetical protein
VGLGALPPGHDDGGTWHPHGDGPSGFEEPDALVRAARHAVSGHYRLRYADETVFVIDSRGERVWGTWPSGHTVEDAATYLLGPVFGFVLRLRGTASLHASVVAIDGRAIVLASHAGGGKSSTAAGFALAGFPVMSDDIAALDEAAGEILVRPAYPRVRLWRESVKSLFGDADALPPISPSWDKCHLSLGGQAPFGSERLPLDCVYFLDDRVAQAAPRFARMDSREGLVWLLGHTYVNYLLDKRMRAAEFELLSRVATTVPLVRVSAADDMGRVGDLCRALAVDARTRRAARGRRAQHAAV